MVLSSVLLQATHGFYRDDAIRYVRGFGYELTDRKQLDRLTEIYVYLHKDKAGKPVVPPEWPKGKYMR